MKQLGAGMIIGVLLALLGSLLFTAAPLLGFTMVLVAGLLGPIITWATLPGLAKASANAETRNGVTLLLYTHDDRLLPIPAIYDPEKHIIRPMGRLRNKLVVFPDPESTMSLYGHRQKLAIVHIDQPIAVSPKYLAIVYDMKYRYQAESLGVALDMDRAARKGIEELEQEEQKTRELLALVEQSLENPQAVQQLAEKLGKEPEELDEQTLLQLRESLQKRLEIIETAKTLAKKYGKPVAIIGARVYTVKDLIGYLGFRLRNTSLRTIKELARLETLERIGRRWSEYMPWITIMMLGVIALAIVALVAGHGGGVHASLPHSLPTKIINVNTTTHTAANATAAHAVNATG